MLALAQVKHVALVPHFSEPKPAVDSVTLQAVSACRYDVLAKYARYLKRIYVEELGKLKQVSPRGRLTIAQRRAVAELQRENAAPTRPRTPR